MFESLHYTALSAKEELCESHEWHEQHEQQLGYFRPGQREPTPALWHEFPELRGAPWKLHVANVQVAAGSPIIRAPLRRQPGLWSIQCLVPWSCPRAGLHWSGADLLYFTEVRSVLAFRLLWGRANCRGLMDCVCLHFFCIRRKERRNPHRTSTLGRRRLGLGTRTRQYSRAPHWKTESVSEFGR